MGSIVRPMKRSPTRAAIFLGLTDTESKGAEAVGVAVGGGAGVVAALQPATASRAPRAAAQSRAMTGASFLSPE